MKWQTRRTSKAGLLQLLCQIILIGGKSRFVGSRDGLVVVGEVEKHTLAKPLLAWRDPSPMPVQSVGLTFVGVEGRCSIKIIGIFWEPREMYVEHL